MMHSDATGQLRAWRRAPTAEQCGHSKPSKSSHCMPSDRPEKNWAFFEHQGALHFMHSLLPCTLAFLYDPATPKGAVLTHAYCYPDTDTVRCNVA